MRVHAEGIAAIAAGPLQQEHEPTMALARSSCQKQLQISIVLLALLFVANADIEANSAEEPGTCTDIQHRQLLASSDQTGQKQSHKPSGLSDFFKNLWGKLTGSDEHDRSSVKPSTTAVPTTAEIIEKVKDDEQPAETEAEPSPIIPANPLEPQPGEVLPDGLKEQLEQSEQQAPAAQSSSDPVPILVDTVTVKFTTAGITASAFQTSYLSLAADITARLSGTSTQQWHTRVSSTQATEPVTAVSPSPEPLQSPELSPSPLPESPDNITSPEPEALPNPEPVTNSTAGPSTSPGPLQSPLPHPSPAVSPMPSPKSSPNAPVSPEPVKPLPSPLPWRWPVPICTGRGCGTVDPGHKRSLLQPQQQPAEATVLLSILTANPQLVVFRLKQPAQDKTAVAQLACTSELCFRYYAASIPFEPSSITISPNYDGTYGSSYMRSQSAQEAELARRRQTAAIAGGVGAGGFVLLLLLLTYKKWKSCCVALLAATDNKQGGFPPSTRRQTSRDAKEQDEVQKQTAAADQHSDTAPVCCFADQVIHATPRRSKLLQHGTFDPRTLSNSSTGAAANGTTTPWVTLVMPMENTAQGTPTAQQSPAHQHQNATQQQAMSAMQFYASSFKDWHSASIAASADRAAQQVSPTKHSEASSAPEFPTPSSLQLDLASALPNSPISTPMVKDPSSSAHSQQLNGTQAIHHCQHLQLQQGHLAPGQCHAQHIQHEPALSAPEKHEDCNSTSHQLNAEAPASPMSNPLARVPRQVNVGTSISTTSSKPLSWPARLGAARVRPRKTRGKMSVPGVHFDKICRT